jgi:hypothetical protein
VSRAADRPRRGRAALAPLAPSRRPPPPKPARPADCCDGTDELEGCKNTCIERNAVVREGLLQQVEEYKQALAKRKDYAAGAAQARKDMKERLASIDGDIAAAAKEVERLAGVGLRR